MRIYHKNISAKTKFLNLIRKTLAGRGIDSVLASLMRRFPSLRPLTGKIIAPEYLYKKPSWRNYNSNGIKMKLDISNLVDHFIYFSFDHKAISNFVDKLKPADTVIDIGANIGYTTLLFAKKCPEGKVISIEPSKDSYRILNEHIILNSLTNTETLNIGLGDKAGTAKLYTVDEYNTGMNCVLEDGNTDLHSESIEIITLDDLVASRPIQKIDAIKLDVEGYEYKVLQGALKTLSTFHPLLLIEVDESNLRQQKSSRQILFSFLDKLNYKALNAETMKEIDLRKDHPHPHFDIMCFPKTTQR